MTVVHFATELSGGAGGFVKHLHLAMQELGFSSLAITRERSGASGCVTLKPLTRVAGSLRARSLTLLGKLGVLSTSYAMFGIEPSPVHLSDIRGAVGTRVPSAFIFYWVSYFVDFKMMFQLRQAYPGIPFLFVCMDDALLTGGCHYSWGCAGYEGSCSDCPATPVTALKKRIERGFRERQAVVGVIDPIVIYPTSNVQQMGKKSAVLGKVRSTVVPLGALSRSELELAVNPDRHGKACGEKLRLLVRSSAEHRKGCDLLVSALTLLTGQMPDLGDRLEIVSIGDQTLAASQIGRYVSHVDMGYVKREQLISIYQEIDAFIVTSREDGGPLMTNECVALGIFVISTPIGVARDLIRQEENGLITRDISSEAIADSLWELLCRGTASPAAGISATRAQQTSLTFEGYAQAVMAVIEGPAS